MQSVDSLILDGNGIILTTTVTLFPKFNYAHDGIFSFTLQYAQNTTGNLVWNSLPPNNFYSPFPGKTNSSGYIGGRITGVISIMNPLTSIFFLDTVYQQGQSLYLRAFGTAQLYAPGSVSAPISVQTIAPPDCSAVQPSVAYVYGTATIGLNITWGN